MRAYVAATMGIRILSKKDLRQLVLYSPAQIDRLEKAGRFPKRVQLGPCRVGWVEERSPRVARGAPRAREIMTAPEQSRNSRRRD